MSRRQSLGALIFLGLLPLLALAEEAGAPLHLALPTDNHALFSGHYSEFYQVIERNLHGVISHPWEGGQYGFVRDPIKTAGRTAYTRFHEGMDIQPVRRDAHGAPLDALHPLAAGHVAHVRPGRGAPLTVPATGGGAARARREVTGYPGRGRKVGSVVFAAERWMV